MTDDRTMLDVPVAGGTLRVARHPGSGPAVLALHGVTASHVMFDPIAEQLAGQVDLIAPDLRGRGASSGLPGPFGLQAHVADCVAVLDALGIARCVVVGVSMGGFVAALLAERHPDRVSDVLLVDGGVPLGIEPPTDGSVDVDAVLEAVLGPALARLRMRFPDHAAYHDFWRGHPALAAPGLWGHHLLAYLDYDLTGTEPQLRSRVDGAAVRADSAEVLADLHACTAYERLRCPTVWMRAERGMFDEIPPLYPDARARQVLAANPHLDDVAMVGVNHYTMVLGDAGAAMVADQVRAATGVAAPAPAALLPQSPTQHERTRHHDREPVSRGGVPGDRRALHRARRRRA